MRIKGDILKLVEEEEAKLKSIAQQKEMDEMSKRVLTYEEYYGDSPAHETQAIRDTRSILGHSRKDTKYETFV